MILNFFQWHSLKTRITLFTLVIFLVSIWSLTFYTSRMLREDMQQLLGEQQFSTVTFAAQNINNELATRLQGLESIAQTIDPALLNNPVELQKFLEKQVVLQALFNAGLNIVGTEGIVLADTPRSAGRLGINYSDRDYMTVVLRQGKSVISRPVMGKKLQVPLFVMAAPIHNAQGHVIGALAGVTNLGVTNFLDNITQGRYGKTGGFLLAAPQHNIFVTATDKSRVMRALPAPGINPMHDKYAQGYEGYGLLVNFRGEEELTAAKSIPVAGWFLGLALPTAEAFAPINAMQQRMMLAALLLTLLAGGLTWWMARRQLAPLLTAVSTLTRLSETPQAAQSLLISSKDEIGDLIGGFNRLLETLAHRENALKESESFLLTIIANEPECIKIVDEQGLLLQMNPAGLAMIEADSLEEVAGHPVINVIAPEYRADFATMHQRVLAGESVQLEFEVIGLKGGRRWLQTHAVPLHRQGQTMQLAVTRDITEHKQIEAALHQSEERLRAITDNVNAYMFLKDLNGRYLHVNRQYEKLFLGSNTQIQGKTDHDIYPPDKAAAYVRSDQLILQTGQSCEIEEQVLQDDGMHIYSLVKLPIRDASGNISAICGIATDITERKRAEAELRIAAVAFDSHEAMLVTDANRVILRVNRAFTDITGYTAEEAVGQTPRMLASGRHDAEFYRAMWASIHATGAWRGEVWDRRKNGEIYPKWLTISAVKDALGSVTHYIGMHYDITERKQAEEKIAELAFFDPLTHLPNRTLLMDRLKQAMTVGNRNGAFGAVLFIDLDHFKTLNDTLGHDQGDLLLRQVAQRLAACVREGDTVARLGGDEFVVVLGNLSENSQDAATQTKAVGENILAVLHQQYQLGELDHRSTASVGATLFCGHDTSIDDLLKQADLAMYKAKEAGRNALRFFDPAMQTVVLARAALEKNFRRALLEHQFVLHYQAQVVDAGRVTGAEVLVRWLHPERGMVPPGEFIPLAEETGLILPLGHWVLETACTQLTTWAHQADMAHFTIAVNVSAHQFREADFVEKVLAVLRQTGANPNLLKLELTESLLVDNVQDIIEKCTP